MVANWSGTSYSVEAHRELHAAVIDTGDKDGEELWVMQLGQPDRHRVVKLLRGRIPRARASQSFEAGLDALDFHRAIVTPGAWELDLGPDNLFHWGREGRPAATGEVWEATQPLPQDGPAAAEFLQAPWTVTLAPLEGTPARHFVIIVSPQGEITATVGACTLRGRLHALEGSDWFDVVLRLTDCGSAYDATPLRGFGKLLRPPAPVRFVGAALTPSGRTGLSISALPVLQ